MTPFRPDTSFPFLKIAREYGVPYGEVIRWVEEFARRPYPHPVITDWQADAWMADDAEMRRRVVASRSK